jgi:hypothetical protein
MKTNPGGQLAPDEVVGRDALIAQIWSRLEKQSVILTAERRMGKTSIIKKMAAEPQPGMRVFRVRDLEGARSPLEFVEYVFQDVHQDLSKTDRAMSRVREVLTQIGGAEFMGVKLPQQAQPHWKTILTKMMEDLTDHQEGLQVFLWDELPMMLGNIKRDQGETVAMEVLDTLRALRQTVPRLRMVLTGSIGLHHVISRLQEIGYVNSPTNDIFEVDVAPLSVEDACQLTQRLLSGEGIWTSDAPLLAQEIAETVDCFPFYIHHVVDALKWTTPGPTPEQVQTIVQASLCDDADRWHLAHYRNRIDSYYEKSMHPLVLGILDELAATDGPVSQRDLIDRLGVQGIESNPEAVRKMLHLLGRDHYTVRQADGAYRFKFGLIQRHWRLSRGL